MRSGVLQVMQGVVPCIQQLTMPPVYCGCDSAHCLMHVFPPVTGCCTAYDAHLCYDCHQSVGVPFEAI
jgi:hypothetical protein